MGTFLFYFILFFYFFIFFIIDLVMVGGRAGFKILVFLKRIVSN